MGRMYGAMQENGWWKNGHINESYYVEKTQMW